MSVHHHLPYHSNDHFAGLRERCRKNWLEREINLVDEITWSNLNCVRGQNL